jgi:hypothetical protein
LLPRIFSVGVAIRRVVTEQDLGFPVAAHHEQFGESRPNLVHFSQLQPREVEPVKGRIALRRLLDNADAQISDYGRMRT